MKCSYAEEPVDLKLLCLRMMRKAGVIFAATVLGALLFGGIFYLKGTVFSPDTAYQVVGETYIDYIPEDAYGISRIYITDEVWAALAKSDDFTEYISNEISAQGYSVPAEKIADSVQAAVISDSRIVTTTVVAEEPKLAVAIGTALQNAIMDFCADREEVADTFMITCPKEAQRRVWAEGTATAALLGALLGLLISTVAFMLSFVMDDSVYLPVTFEKRYGLPMFGGLKSEELAVNIKKLCQGSHRLAVAGVAADLSTEEIAEVLKGCLTDAASETRIFSAGCAELNNAWLSKIEETDGVILAIGSGRRDGKQTERVIDFLKKQEVAIKGAVLCDADEALILRYYKPGILKKGKKTCEKKTAEEKA